MASIAKAVAAGRLKVPQTLGAVLTAKREKSVSLTQGNYKRGSGGRSSFSGTVATVFGGTGILGHVTINKLGKVGSQVIVPYRCDSYELRDIPLMGDLGQILFNKFHLMDEDSIRKVIQYSNVVVNLIGKDHESRNYSYEDVYVDWPRRLARLAREAGVEKFIHVSHLNAPLRSQNVLAGGSRLLQAKYEGEAAVMEEFPDATIIRPSDIISEFGGWLYLYTSDALTARIPDAQIHWRKRYPLWHGGKKVLKMPVNITDFTKGVEAIINSNESKGKIYQFVGPRAYTMYNLLEFIRGCYYDFSYAHTSNFFFIMSKAQAQAELYRRTGMKIPQVTPDRLERETISDLLDERLPTLEDLGIKPGNIEPYIEYILRPEVGANRFFQELGKVPEPPKLDAVYYTTKDQTRARKMIVDI